jgi:5-methyltetrahydropteroyltriglutamate--homocysteine methyltransferase
MKRSERRILTTHVGSLVRPTGLSELRLAASQSPEAERAWDDALRASVAEVVRLQAEHRVDIVSEGEFGKSQWAQYIIERMSGWETRPDQRRRTKWVGRDFETFHEHYIAHMPFLADGMPTDACVGPITYIGQRDLARALDAFKAALVGVKVEDAFFTAVAPASTGYDGVNEYYRTERDYIYAIAEALAVEYRAIVDAGFVLQVDDAVLANYYDLQVQERGLSGWREWAQLRIDALNHALTGIPEDRVRYHICYGSWHGPHLCDAPFADVAPFMLQVNAQGYSFEAANVRHEHEWRVWKDLDLPKGKILLPGVVTHHTEMVEHPALIAERIVRYAQIAGRENVIASTDCGFAQADFIVRCDPKIIWAKMGALAEGAALATRELWG